MKSWLKNLLTFTIGLGVGVFFLYILLRDRDIGKIWGHIKEANLTWLLLSVIIIFMAYLTRVARWYYILLPVKKTGFYNLFVATIVGFMTVAVLPLRVGEIIRPYLLARREKISKSLTFATIIPVERLFDLAAIISLFVVYLVLAPVPSGAAAEQLDALNSLKSASIFLIIGIGAIGVFFVLLSVKTEQFLKISGKIFTALSKRWGERINSVFASFVNGLTIIKSPKQFIYVYFWSIATWFAIGLAFWCVVLAFGVSIPMYFIFILLPLTAAGAAIPVPAGLGTWHGMAYIGVHYFYGVPDSLALGIVFVMHLVGFAVAVIIGSFFAVGELKDISDILRRRKDEKEAKSIS